MTFKSKLVAVLLCASALAGCQTTASSIPGPDPILDSQIYPPQGPVALRLSNDAHSTCITQHLMETSPGQNIPIVLTKENKVVDGAVYKNTYFLNIDSEGQMPLFHTVSNINEDGSLGGTSLNFKDISGQRPSSEDMAILLPLIEAFNFEGLYVGQSYEVGSPFKTTNKLMIALEPLMKKHKANFRIDHMKEDITVRGITMQDGREILVASGTTDGKISSIKEPFSMQQTSEITYGIDLKTGLLKFWTSQGKATYRLGQETETKEDSTFGKCTIH